MGNSLGKDIEGQYVLIEKEHLKPEFHENFKRVFKATGGFGCSRVTSGQGVYGHYVWDKEECRVEGWELERLATKEEIKKANDYFLKHSDKNFNMIKG